MPVLAFILFMVLNIAAIIRVRARVHTLSPENFYAAALHFSQDCFSHISLATIQALTVLLVHCLLIPAEANVWTLTHLAMAHCVELGVHRDQPHGAHYEWDHQQLRRSIFYTIYSLDRFCAFLSCLLCFTSPNIKKQIYILNSRAAFGSS